jgi:hypothetical protein
MSLGIEINKTFIQWVIVKNYQLSNAYSGELIKISVVNCGLQIGSLYNIGYATLSRLCYIRYLTTLSIKSPNNSDMLQFCYAIAPLFDTTG